MSPKRLPRRFSHILLALTIATFATFPGAQLIPDGPVIDLTTAGWRPMLDTDPAGNTVVAWQEYPASGVPDLYVQRIGPTGALISIPIQAAEDAFYGGGFYSYPQHDIALTSGGAFAAVWGSGNGRTFNGDGQPANDFAVYGQGGSYLDFPRVTGRPQGDFVVGWVDGVPDDGQGFYQQRFNADAEPVGLVVDSGTEIYNVAGELDMNTAGEFKVIWSSDYPDIFAAGFDVSDSLLGTDTIGTFQSWSGQDISVAEDGSFVAAWLALGGGFTPTFQRFDGAANPLSLATAITDPMDSAGGVAVAHDGFGEFIVVWSGVDAGADVFEAQQFDSSGAPLGESFTVSPVVGAQPRADMDTDGNLTVVWGYGPDSSSRSIRMRRFCGPLRIMSPPSQAACAGGAAILDASVFGRFPFSHQWRRDEIPLADGGNVSGALTETLMLAPVAPADSGSYDLSVTDSCLTPTSDFSIPVRLDVFSLPPDQNLTDLAVLTDAGDSQLTFRWSDLPGAYDYEVRQDTSPNGGFATPTGTAGSGDPGLTVAMPSGTVFYLAVPRNPCGEGPLRIPSS